MGTAVDQGQYKGSDGNEHGAAVITSNILLSKYYFVKSLVILNPYKLWIRVSLPLRPYDDGLLHTSADKAMLIESCWQCWMNLVAVQLI